MRRLVQAIFGGLFLSAMLFVGQGCSYPCHDYSGHNLLHSAAASCDEVVTKSYVRAALDCSCNNNKGKPCECHHRLGVDGKDCTCHRVDKFDGRCRCDWRAPYCLNGYYQ
ncbi:MAG: hypothetical protein AAB434_11895 [Planctomycetota bacterium]